jgi:branched-chain amino acid transport system substrate-binding protein
MKKTFFLFLMGVVLLCLVVGCGSSGGNVVKIGVYEPASGSNGAGGKQEILGMQYANSITPNVEIGGKTYKVELVMADNESDSSKAVSAAQTLIAANSSVILGSYGSGVSMAASETFRDAGLAAVGISCTNPGVTQGNTHYFRICFLDPFQGTVLSSFAKEEFGATKAYVLAELGDDYSEGLAHFFTVAFGETNCITDKFPNGTSDFSTYITSAKAQGCNVFFCPSSIESAVLIIDQANTLGLGMPVLAGDTWDSNKVLEATQGKGVEVFVTTFYQESGTEFDKGFKKWLNETSWALQNNGGNDIIAAVSALGYDGYYVALEALKKAGSVEKGKILTIMPSVTYTGVTGDIAFDPVGDAFRNSAFVKRADTNSNDWALVKLQVI